MEQSPINKLAKILQVLRGLEADLGLGSLSKTEKAVFTSIADLSTENNKIVNVKDIVAHPDLKSMPIPTLYKCLRDLQDKGLLEKSGAQRSGLYKIA